MISGSPEFGNLRWHGDLDHAQKPNPANIKTNIVRGLSFMFFYVIFLYNYIYYRQNYIGVSGRATAAAAATATATATAAADELSQPIQAPSQGVQGSNIP